ncbi:SDR family NAD(P)-dependent oxidoreductase [Rhodococcus hoagii]|nr:SDR family NAD(P)-dependent oxidoreductase [Prescottella equi]
MFKTLRAVTPHMIDRGTDVSSRRRRWRTHRHPEPVAHVAAKWGVIVLVKTLALELARHGITVNAVCPGSVDTRWCTTRRSTGLFAPDVEHPPGRPWSRAMPRSRRCGCRGWHRRTSRTRCCTWCRSRRVRHRDLARRQRRQFGN